jgi:hypothetical protein
VARGEPGWRAGESSAVFDWRCGREWERLVQVNVGDTDVAERTNGLLLR